MATPTKSDIEAEICDTEEKLLQSRRYLTQVYEGSLITGRTSELVSPLMNALVEAETIAAERIASLKKQLEALEN